MKKISWRQVLLLSLIPLGGEMLWAIYNSYVPLYLQAGSELFHSDTIAKGFALGPFLTSFILTIDNIANLIISPFIGSLSDRPNRKGERRMPYLRWLVPIAALGSIGIPFTAMLLYTDTAYGLVLFLFMASLMTVCIAWSSVGVLVTALRWDVVPPSQRSRVQAWVLIIASVGNVCIALIGAKFFSVYQPLIFIIVAAVLIIAVMLVSCFHHEPKVPVESREVKTGLRETIREIKSRGTVYKRELAFFCIAALCYQLGISTQQAQITSYYVSYMHIEEGMAGLMSISVFFISVFMAIPVSMVASKLGLKNAIRLGMLISVLLYIVMFFVSEMWMLYMFIPFSGISTCLMIVNMPPLTANVSPSDRHLGAFVSLITILFTIGNIIGPTLSGGLIQFVFGSNYRYMWLISASCLLLGFITLSQVKTIERKGGNLDMT